MYYIKSKKQLETHNQESYLIQKIWGCLADITPYTRYSLLANSNDYDNDNRLTVEEEKLFIEQVEKTFRIIPIIDRKKKLRSIITDIKKQVRRYENEQKTKEK